MSQNIWVATWTKLHHVPLLAFLPVPEVGEKHLLNIRIWKFPLVAKKILYQIYISKFQPLVYERIFHSWCFLKTAYSCSALLAICKWSTHKDLSMKNHPSFLKFRGAGFNVRVNDWRPSFEHANAVPYITLSLNSSKAVFSVMQGLYICFNNYKEAIC